MWAEDADPDPDPNSPVLDPVIQHLLEVSLQQSQLYQEMARGLHMTNHKLLPLRQVAPAPAVPLLDLAQDTQQLLMKLTVDDDVEVFLGTFERVAT